MADPVADKISENAQGPKRARGDSGEIEQHDLKDQIEADKYLKSKDAASGATLGVRRVKLIPPGIT